MASSVRSLDPAVIAAGGASRPTSTRILDAALSSFAAKGFEAVSLDALAAQLGVTKQTILHHFGSKDAVLAGVLERTVAEVAGVVDDALLASVGSRRTPLETVVRAVFGVAGRRPELLGFLREVGRLGPPHSERLVRALEPLTERATAFLTSDAGSHERARRAVHAAYAAVLGAVTELEVLRHIGARPSARLLVRRRRELLSYVGDLLA